MSFELWSEVLNTQPIRAFLQQLENNTQQSPVAGSAPLYIGDKVCGYVAPAALEVLQARLPKSVTTTGVTLDRSANLDAKLAQIARLLHEAGCITKWRGELLDVWQDGLSIAALERGAVRPLGLLTRAVHLNAWSEDGRLWAARRALDKPTDPGMWDTLVGGLVGYGEPDDLALIRESAEEAGLSQGDIALREPLRCIYRMQRQVPEGFQCEDVLTSDCVLGPDVVPANQDGEVMEIACLPIETLQQMLFAGEFTVEASIVIAQSLLTRLED